MLYKVEFRYRPGRNYPTGSKWADVHSDTGLPGNKDKAISVAQAQRAAWGHIADYRVVPAGPRELIYVAHPVGEQPLMNCFNALQWVRWLTANEPTRVYIAPWIAEVLAHLDVPNIVPGSEMWEKVLSNDEQVVDRCDGILLVGGRISVGMARERDRAMAAKSGKSVTDLSQYRSPNDLPDGFFLDPAYEE